jgi:hypothetical protein
MAYALANMMLPHPHISMQQSYGWVWDTCANQPRACVSCAGRVQYTAGARSQPQLLTHGPSSQWDTVSSHTLAGGLHTARQSRLEACSFEV